MPQKSVNFSNFPKLHLFVMLFLVLSVPLWCATPLHVPTALRVGGSGLWLDPCLASG